MIPIAAAVPDLVPFPEQVSTAPGIWHVAVTWLAVRDSTKGPPEQFPFSWQGHHHASACFGAMSVLL